MADILLDLTILGAIDWRTNPCSRCLRPKHEHTGTFWACPDHEYPAIGEQLWLDDRPMGPG
jgi:hypothetical protein